MKKRNYRKGYDSYYGKRGINTKRTAKQELRRREKSGMNKARRFLKKKYGAAALRGKDVHHKNHNQLDNRPENLQIMSIHKNRSDNGQ